jgi:hypothetical protein
VPAAIEEVARKLLGLSLSIILPSRKREESTNSIFLTW